ncbi:MAG TPA: IS256 family transposase, partial [Gammaproteobacteria bacterium]|nr:IS256 family transposase [Gammaproteobacteria bacterium]
MATSYQHQKLVVVPEDDPLEAISRQGAQRMLTVALEREVEEYLERQHYVRRLDDSEFRGYRNGYGRERQVTIGSGTIKVRAPRVSDTPAEQEPFASQILKPYQKRSQKLAELFPKLFVEGLATRDFEPALRCLLGQSAALSPATIVRLNAQFKAEYEEWRQQSLAEQRFVYIWVDGVHIKAGVARENAAVLTVIGADVDGRKHLIALEEGYRESKESWLEVLRSLRDRGMQAPVLAVGDGALGFWAALAEIWPHTKCQRCWFHKMGNVLDKLPQKERKEATPRLRAVYLADSRSAAERLAHELASEWQKSYPKAATCLLTELDACLHYFDYPREHWKHLRTTNPVESTFSTMRLRTDAAKRFRTARSGVHLVFKLFQRYQKT